MHDFVYVHTFLCLSTAAINVTKVTVDISPSDDDVIPVVLDLQDDSIVEPMDSYQVMILNTSDPNVAVGEINTVFIVVNDDDEDRKILIIIIRNCKIDNVIKMVHYTFKSTYLCLAYLLAFLYTQNT